MKFKPRLGQALAAMTAIAIAVTSAMASRPAAADLRTTINRIKPSIVAVGTYHELRRPPSRLLGTGFVVGDGRHIVTNSHVLAGGKAETRGGFPAVFTGAGRRAKVRRVEIVARDEAHDVAILRLAGGRPLPTVKLGDDDKVGEGQLIAFTGFPIGAVLGLFPVTHRGIVSARTPIAIPTPSPGQLNATMIKRLRQGFEVFQLDATAYPGNSGSPLYDPNSGEVYGIVSSVFVKKSKERLLKDPSGITFAVPIGHARRLLEELGISR